MLGRKEEAVLAKEISSSQGWHGTISMCPHSCSEGLGSSSLSIKPCSEDPSCQLSWSPWSLHSQPCQTGIMGFANPVNAREQQCELTSRCELCCSLLCPLSLRLYIFCADSVSCSTLCPRVCAFPQDRACFELDLLCWQCCFAPVCPLPLHVPDSASFPSLLYKLQLSEPLPAPLLLYLWLRSDAKA